MSSAANRPPAARDCPICGRPGHSRFQPFCSRRCADIDLGRWLKGGYAVPGEAQPDAGAGQSVEPDTDEAPES
jgi:hypothetical protein